MTRPTPAEAALAMERRLSRRLRRWRARALEALAGREGPSRMPHPLAWRMRELIHAAPPRARVFAAAGERRPGPQILLVSNDLSFSGAPQVLAEMARLLLEAGMAVTVLSPTDGGRRAQLTEAGACVIVDPGVSQPGSPLIAALPGTVDVAFCNTVVTAPALAALAPSVPTIWYLHESSFLAEQLAAVPAAAAALAGAARVWAVSEVPGAILRPLRPDVRIVPYGLDPLGDAAGPRPVAAGALLRLGVFGSLEPRKGQDLLIDAVARLGPDVRSQIAVVMHGRALHPAYAADLAERARDLPEVTIGAALGPDDYRRAILGVDAVVVPSRDDPLPIAAADGLGAGRVVMVTRETGTAAHLAPGHDGFVADAATPQALAAMLEDAVARRADWPAIAARGRDVFARAFSKAAFGAAIGEDLRSVQSGPIWTGSRI